MARRPKHHQQRKATSHRPKPIVRVGSSRKIVVIAKQREYDEERWKTFLLMLAEWKALKRQEAGLRSGIDSTETLASPAQEVDNKNAMSDDQFTKLFKYMSERFDTLESKIDDKADSETTYRLLDGIAKRLGIDDDERVAMSSQLDRHEHWIKEVARKLDLKLSHDI